MGKRVTKATSRSTNQAKYARRQMQRCQPTDRGEQLNITQKSLRCREQNSWNNPAGGVVDMPSTSRSIGSKAKVSNDPESVSGAKRCGQGHAKQTPVGIQSSRSNLSSSFHDSYTQYLNKDSTQLGKERGCLIRKQQKTSGKRCLLSCSRSKTSLITKQTHLNSSCVSVPGKLTGKTNQRHKSVVKHSTNLKTSTKSKCNVKPRKDKNNCKTVTTFKSDKKRPLANSLTQKEKPSGKSQNVGKKQNSTSEESWSTEINGLFLTISDRVPARVKHNAGRVSVADKSAQVCTDPAGSLQGKTRSPDQKADSTGRTDGWIKTFTNPEHSVTVSSFIDSDDTSLPVLPLHKRNKRRCSLDAEEKIQTSPKCKHKKDDGSTVVPNTLVNRFDELDNHLPDSSELTVQNVDDIPSGCHQFKDCDHCVSSTEAAVDAKSTSCDQRSPCQVRKVSEGNISAGSEEECSYTPPRDLGKVKLDLTRKKRKQQRAALRRNRITRNLLRYAQTFQDIASSDSEANTRPDSHQDDRHLAVGHEFETSDEDCSKVPAEYAFCEETTNSADMALSCSLGYFEDSCSLDNCDKLEQGDINDITFDRSSIQEHDVDDSAYFGFQSSPEREGKRKIEKVLNYECDTSTGYLSMELDRYESGPFVDQDLQNSDSSLEEESGLCMISEQKDNVFRVGLVNYSSSSEEDESFSSQVVSSTNSLKTVEAWPDLLQAENGICASSASVSAVNGQELVSESSEIRDTLAEILIPETETSPELNKSDRQSPELNKPDKQSLCHLKTYLSEFDGKRKTDQSLAVQTMPDGCDEAMTEETKPDQDASESFHENDVAETHSDLYTQSDDLEAADEDDPVSEVTVATTVATTRSSVSTRSCVAFRCEDNEECDMYAFDLASSTNCVEKRVPIKNKRKTKNSPVRGHFGWELSLRQNPAKRQLYQVGESNTISSTDDEGSDDLPRQLNGPNTPSTRQRSFFIGTIESDETKVPLKKGNVASETADAGRKRKLSPKTGSAGDTSAVEETSSATKSTGMDDSETVSATKSTGMDDSETTSATQNTGMDESGMEKKKLSPRSIAASASGVDRKRSGKTAGSTGKKKEPECIVLETDEELARVIEVEPNFGKFVWARLSGERWWPGLIIKGTLVCLQSEKVSSSWIYWFGDHKVSLVTRDKIVSFTDNFASKIGNFKSKFYRKAILEVLTECVHRSKVAVSSDVQLLDWANNGFPGAAHGTKANMDPDPDSPVPDSVMTYLEQIGREIRQKASTMNFNHRDDIEENAIDFVRKGEKELKDVCLGCSSLDKTVVCEHPLFNGGLCQDCKNEVTETMYAVGEDGLHSFCTVCGAGGDLFVCDSPDCRRVYCRPCVEEVGGENTLTQVVKASHWLCFLCSPYTEGGECLLHPRSNWQERVIMFFDSGYRVQVPSFDYFNTKRPMRVLSLYDGIGSGKLVLDKLGFKVDAYFASEIDSDALLVTKCYHGNSVTHVGDVTCLDDRKLSEFGPIDLLIGGSPCNDLSLANPARRGFQENSSALLFFDYVRIRDKLQRLNDNTHLFWLYENVASMKTEFKNTMSRFLECQPSLWDSKHMTASRRGRFFWGNIPGLYSTPAISTHMCKDVDLNSVLEQNCNRRAVINKMGCITTRSNSLKHGKKDELFPVEMEGAACGIWIQEVERIFGFPPHYTDVGNFSVTRRHKLLGKSWSIPVVERIIEPLKQYFATAEEEQD